MPPKPRKDSRSVEDRKAARLAFGTAMRQAAMEYDSVMQGPAGSEIDFRSFSRMIREREVGIHSEEALLERFSEIDTDGSGMIDVTEFINFALRDALMRSAANLSDLLADWDNDGNGTLDKAEFRDAVRHYGFEADDALIDAVFDGLDSMRNGFLRLEDLTNALRLELQGKKRPLQGLRVLRQLDAREKATVCGVLDASADASLGSQVRALLQSQGARAMEIFRGWDTSGDGLLDKSEFCQALKALGYAGPRRAIDAVFDEIDTDGACTLHERTRACA